MTSNIVVVKSGGRIAWLRKKPVTILAIMAVGIALGYLFFLSWLLGVLLCRFLSGKSTGQRGKIRSIVIPVRGWKIHFHHWLYAICLLAFSFATGIYLLTPIITYGFLGGVVFHGIYYYSDWHRVIASRQGIVPDVMTSYEIVQNSQAEFATYGEKSLS
jgi:hypothetical protein